MNVKKQFKQFEKAQVLPTAVMAFFVLIAFSALVIDGGSIMLNRRSSQTAADAGALAGARELCYPSGANPLDVAANYAMMNGAETANAYYDKGSVAVSITATSNSFFSKIFNQQSLDANAEAAAGCFPPKGNYLMPIAWSCRPPVGGGSFDPLLGCKMMTLDWDGLLKPLVKRSVSSIQIPGNSGDFELWRDYDIVHTDTRKPPAQIYIIMDKLSTNKETLCKEGLNPADPLYTNAITCDLNGDGKNDIEGDGNRGWLDLNNGGGGTSELRNWIRYGLNSPISPHTWLSGETGNVTPLYQAMKDYRRGQVVWIPVFNALCDDKNPTSNSACMDAAHAAGFPPVPPGGDIDMAGSKPKFHVVTFDAFYVSCVHIHSSDFCPGFKLAQEMNPDPKNPSKSLIPDNMPSIEGYFLYNVETSLDLTQSCDINLGNCVVSLLK